jgi:hypothetical protein
VKYQGKTLLDYQYTLEKMKDRKVKLVFSGSGKQLEGLSIRKE